MISNDGNSYGFSIAQIIHKTVVRNLKTIKIILTLFALIFLFSCQSYTELSEKEKDVNNLININKLFLESTNKYSFINSMSDIEEPQIQSRFHELKEVKNLEYIDFKSSGLIFYKLKNENVKSFMNLGAQRYSHYLVYSDNSDVNFFKIFEEDFEMEESVENVENLIKNWYYVIGVSYID